MPNRRMLHVFVIACCRVGTALNTQVATSLEAEQTKTEIYFGPEMGAGHAVSEQAWEDFLATVVRERFPTGFTVIDALGKGTHSDGPLTRTIIVIVVHPTDADAEARLNEIKMEYKKRFGSAGVFHVDQVVRVQE